MLFEGLANSVQKICALVTITYFASRTELFARVFRFAARPGDRLFAFLFFSALAAAEALFSAHDSLLDAGIVSAAAAGLVGGVWPGVGVGAVSAAAAKMLQSSWSLVDALPPVLVGAIGGWVCQFSPVFAQRILAGFLAGMLGHGIWLAVRLQQDYLIGSWDAAAVHYVLPMIVSGVGVALFLFIVGDMRAQRERIERSELARALGEANRFPSTASRGCDEASAAHTATMVQRLTRVPAVAVVMADKLLAHVGEAAEYHRGAGEVPEIARQAIADGERHATDRRERPGCPFGSAVAIPIACEGRPVCSVVLYETRQARFRPEVVDLAAEMAQFLVNYQMRVLQAETQAQAASRAELKALQAQVHPHFLFNALNTLAGLCEIAPSEAARLTVKLGEFFRSSLRSERALMSSVSEELDMVRVYLDIEKARFGDRLKVIEDICREADNCLIPSFSIQPLVENAIVHGVSRKAGPGRVRIATRIRNGHLLCFVADNGNGFADGSGDWAEREGHALPMLKGRLDRIYGGDYRLRIRTKANEGTVVCLQVPRNQEN